jgi:hypothetical protein
MNDLNEVLKTVITSLSITAVISVVTVATAGAFAGPNAVAWLAPISRVMGQLDSSVCYLVEVLA